MYKMEKLAAIQIRGNMKLTQDKKMTLKLLKLYKKNYCVVLDKKLNYINMLNVIKDNITWGELNENTFLKLLKERGRLAGNKRLTEEYLKEKLNLTFEGFVKDFFDNKNNLKDVPGLKPFFRLKPPEKGFERKGIKSPFSMGGALGYRKDKINDLIIRML